MSPPNVILIGAGRGSRLMPFTEHEPKCFTTIAGKRILDWALDAFRCNGLDRFVFIGGYLIDVVRSSYPQFQLVENIDWSNNNILLSLMYARDYMEQGFYATYTDTLFRPDAVTALRNSPHDITLVMDTQWRQRYRFRSQHPESDGEKMLSDGPLVTKVSRSIPPEEATGEFTGVIRFSAKGTADLLAFYDDLSSQFGDDESFHDRPFRMAYLIYQLDLMIQAGIPVHCVHVPGEYHEIDTVEDYHLARQAWAKYE